MQLETNWVANLTYAIIDDALLGLPEATVDEDDVRRAAVHSVEQLTEGEDFPWNRVRGLMLEWTDPEYAQPEMLELLPDGFRESVSALPEGTPSDLGPLRALYITFIHARAWGELDEEDDE